MTGLGLEPSDVVWSPYRFCYKDEHCLLGCQKKENEDTGVCFVMDENFPPETGTHILCSVDDDCYTYRKKLYDDDKVRRLKRSVDAETLDADLKSHLQLLGKKLGFE
ncbi:hypothetical protein HK097_006398 [Rhizophlyctis rosea]|uniref:Uncharacterized protein n=1 Tax=Rhizophlyctis rosea TaxID=64517 RepID=A0AAD5SKG0_9FUNG|nr:hypothetical protein HK097_006398 [Rhizophlyctis rosea]